MGLGMSYLRVPPELDGEHDPARIARRVFGDPAWRARPPGELLDLGGAWQALHYLITGDPWDGPEPGCDVVCGGRLLTEDGSEELGADVIYLAPDRVKLCADHLAGTPFRAVAFRFDPAAMVNAGVQDAGHLDLRARDRVLEPAYTALTSLFAAAATEGQPVYKTMFETP